MSENDLSLDIGSLDTSGLLGASPLHSPAATAFGPAMKHAVLDWVNTFQSHGNVFEEPCASLGDLADGVALFQILSYLDADHFDASVLNTATNDNPVTRLSNIKKLVEALEVVLAAKGNNTEEASHISIAAIGQQANEDEIMKLLELVLFISVTCDNKEEAIGHMMEMEEDMAHQMMIIINNAQERYTPSHFLNVTNPDNHSTFSGDRSPLASPRHGASGVGSSVNHAEVVALQENVEKLEADKDSLMSRIDALNAEIKGLKRDNARQEEELHEQGLILESEKERAVASAKEAIESKANQELERRRREENHLKQIVEELRIDLAKAEKNADDARASLTDEVEELKSENRSLHDELDVAKDKAKKLDATEATLEKYKQKLSEIGDVRARLVEIEGQHMKDVQRIFELEKANEELPKLKASLASVLEEKSSLQQQVDEFNVVRDTLSGKVGMLEEQKEKLESDLVTARSRCEDLERDLLVANSQASQGSSMGAALGDDLGASNDDLDLPLHVKEKIMRLELENASLKEQTEQGGSSDVLVHENEDLKKRLADAQEKYRESNSEVMRLQHEVTIAASTAASSAASGAGNQAEVDRLQQEIAHMKQLLKKAAEDRLRLQSEAAAAKGAVKKEEHDEVQKRYAELMTYTKSLKKAFADLKKKHDSSASAGGSPSKRDSEFIRALQAKIHDQNGEIEMQKKLRNEYKDVTRSELQLMSSAFYELGQEFQLHLAGGLTGTASGNTPHRNSWLNKQRARHNRH